MTTQTRQVIGRGVAWLEQDDSDLASMTEAGLSDNEIAARLNRGAEAVKARRKILKQPTQSRIRRRRIDAEIRRLFHEGATDREIGRQLNIPSRTVCTNRARLKLHRIDPAERLWSEDEEQILRRLVESGTTDQEIGGTLGRSVSAIRERRSRLHLSHEAIRLGRHDAEVRRLFESGLSDKEIGAALGREPSTIMSTRQKLGLNREKRLHPDRKAMKERSEQYGWPEHLTDIQVRALNVMWEVAFATSITLASHLGIKVDAAWYCLSVLEKKGMVLRTSKFVKQFVFVLSPIAIADPRREKERAMLKALTNLNGSPDRPSELPPWMANMCNMITEVADDATLRKIFAVQVEKAKKGNLAAGAFVQEMATQAHMAMHMFGQSPRPSPPIETTATTPSIETTATTPRNVENDQFDVLCRLQDARGRLKIRDLSEVLDGNEQATRVAVKCLSEQGLVTSSTSGFAITEEGSRSLNRRGDGNGPEAGIDVVGGSVEDPGRPE